MKEITRYHLHSSFTGAISEKPDGEYVLYTDYTTLKDRADRLEKVLRGMCDASYTLDRTCENEVWMKFHASYTDGRELLKSIENETALTSNTEDKGV